MVRVRTALLMATFCYAGAALAKPEAVSSAVPAASFWLVVLAITFGYAFATSVNDLADESIDQVNLVHHAAERPLVKGNASRSELQHVALIAAILAVLCGGLAGAVPVIAVCCLLGIGYVYSMPPIQLSYRGVIAVLVLPIVYVVIPMVSAFVLFRTQIKSSDWFLLIGFYTSFAGRIILKDIRDVKGDTKFNKRTFIVRHGRTATCRFAIASWVIGTIFLIAAIQSVLLAVILVAWCLVIIKLLGMLQSEGVLSNQLVIVAAVGRAGNAVLLSVVTYVVTMQQSVFVQVVLLAGVSCVFASMVYETILHLQAGRIQPSQTSTYLSA